MPRVEAFAINGIELWFNSADHDPAHFHARKPGAWEIRVSIVSTTNKTLSYSFKWPTRGATVAGRLQKELRDATVRHRVTLLVEWENKVVVKERF